MRFLKGFGLTVLTIMLVHCLIALFLGIEIRSTVLSPRFVAAELGRLDLSALFEQAADSPAMRGMPKEIRSAVSGSLSKLGPELGTRTRAALDSAYAYLLGRKDRPELAETLGSTFVNPEFVASLIDSIDIPAIAGAAVKTQLLPRVPDEASWARSYLEERFEKLLVTLEPEIKGQLKEAAVPMAEYLLGKRKSFAVTISPKPLLEAFKRDLLDYARQTPIPQLEGLSGSALENAVDKVFDKLSSALPDSYRVTQSMLGAAVPGQIASGIRSAETALAQARQMVRYFQLALGIVAGAVLLLLAAIALIHHRISPGSRHIGILLLTVGCIELVLYVSAAAFLGPQLAKAAQFGPAFGKWLPEMERGLVLPVLAMAVGEMIVGAGLIVLSIVSKRRKPMAPAATG